jgi:ketosteroid isomerase-like protein
MATVRDDDVEVVTRFLDALSSGHLDSCLDLVTDDLVFSEAASLPFGGDWQGKDGLVGCLRAVGKAFRVRLGEPVISSAGDRVLVRVTGTIASRATGREIPLEALDLYEVRDGLIHRVDVFYKDAAAVIALLDKDRSGLNAERVPT